MPLQRLPVLPQALLVVLPQVALLPLVVPPLLVVLPLLVPLVPLVPLLLVLLLLVPPLPVVSVLSQWVALSQGQPLPVWGLLLLLALSGGLPVRRLVCSPFLRFTIQKINPGSTAGVFCCPRPRRPTPPNWRTLPPAVAS